VSVVVPAYNEERWIGECLTSLADQTHPDYEVIVVDDGSTDATAEIAARFGVRLVRGKHRGAGAARDTGARVADAEILAFLDADEIYAPDFLELLVRPLEQDPSLRGTFPGGIDWENPDEGLAPGWLYVRGARNGRPPAFADSHPFPKALRRSDLLASGGYPVTGHGEDQVLGARLGPARVVPEAHVRFTLPTSPGEVFGKARWIGRGPRFARERPPIRRLLPPESWWKAARLLRAGRRRAACVRVIYDAGLVLGFLESKLRPGVRNVA
jgi:glycosyltransferase involved in cell wall biosynthesis